MKDEVLIKCFKCGSKNLNVGVPMVTVNKVPLLEIDCADCGWDMLGLQITWEQLKLLDMAEKVSVLEGAK